MKRKIIYPTLLFLIICSQIQVQAYTDDSPAVFADSLTIGASFEWVIQKYEVTLRPTPESYTFFKFNDTIKIEIVKIPETILDNWTYYPGANFSDWLKFYKNDVEFDPSSIGHFLQILDFGFIYPTLIGDDESAGFFDYYGESVDYWSATWDTSGGYSWKLGKDYFEVEFDHRSHDYPFYMLRKYNIHTGLLSEFVQEYNNYQDSSYKIRIINPEDIEVASFASFVPLVTFLAVSVIFLNHRRRNMRK